MRRLRKGLNATLGTYAVVGAMGAVGRVVADILTRQGHQIRAMSRRADAPIDDPDVLAAAFHAADGAFLMVPFDRAASDLHGRETEIATLLTRATAAAGTRRVVLLSGTSAHLGSRAGSGMGAAIMERLLDQVDIASGSTCGPASSRRTISASGSSTRPRQGPTPRCSGQTGPPP